MDNYYVVFEIENGGKMFSSASVAHKMQPFSIENGLALVNGEKIKSFTICSSVRSAIELAHDNNRYYKSQGIYGGI